MSIEQEQIVRNFLGPLWQQMPYDWMNLDVEELDEMGYCPTPEAVYEAYIATRGNPEDRARDEHLYGRVVSREEKMREMLRKRAALGLPLIPPFADHYDKLTVAERARFEAYEADLRALIN